MNDYDGILIESLSSYLNNKDIMSGFDSDTAKKLIARSKEQKVLPIIYLKNSSAFEKVLPPQEYFRLKTDVLMSVFSQVQRNAELVRAVGLLEAEGIKSIVFKGAVCRAMYAQPEYRVSSDEDILVEEKQLRKAVGILEQNGYAVLSDESGEIKLINKSLNALTEVHSSLTAPDASEELKQIGALLSEQLDSAESIDIGDGTVYTFKPTYGFLSLCIHFYNHFVRGGIGIRPVMDIACFIKKYSEEIDFEFCFSKLDEIKAEKLIRMLLSVCEKYFGVQCSFKSGEETADDLLDDILNAGAYGTADKSRIHSGTVTKTLANSDKGFISSAVSALFPPEKEIISKHPELKGKSGEINKYRIKRIVNFAGRKGKLDVLRNAEKRNRLFKDLGISE